MYSLFKSVKQKQFLTVFTISVLILPFNNCGSYLDPNLLNNSSLSNTNSEGMDPVEDPSLAALPTFSLTSPQSQTQAPFTLGHAFKKGHVPSGINLNVIGASAQVIVKNRWPDGSIKFAIISGTADLTAQQSLPIKLVRSDLKSEPTLQSSDLKKVNLTASITAEGIGAVNWSASDWESPFQNWISGPSMSSFIYRKEIPGDAHLVAWLEVRVYAGGAVEVLPWIENGYLQVPGPINKNTRYTFSLMGQEKFNLMVDLTHHSRTPLINGSQLSYWLHTDPVITPRHDIEYLQSTELVPTYGIKLDPAKVTNIPTTFVPLQQGNFNYSSDSMASSGYQSAIGLIPSHDVYYLTCPDPCPAYNGVIRNGFSAGRYPIHYRDETTQRPLRFSSYPNLVIHDGCGFKDNGGANLYTPACAGPARSWDTAHSPSVGYMAYLLSGRWYFMEEVQFAATTNYLGLTFTKVMRNFSDGIMHPVPGAFQTRSAAWALRSLAQALTVTPDDDTTLRDEFRKSWETNVLFYHNMYIAQKNNPFGIVQPAEVYGSDGFKTVAIWQQDFLTAAWGYALALDLPVSADIAKKTAEFFQWKAQSIVGRLGTSNDFWYINAAPYVMAVSPSTTANFANGTGPWHSSWKDIYMATYANNPSWKSSTEGLLAAEYTIDSWAKSMWGNLQPAISYAVRFKVPGAQQSYDRMTQASNWKELSSYFNSYPVWYVTPKKK